jgi:hypothetical protein
MFEGLGKETFLYFTTSSIFKVFWYMYQIARYSFRLFGKLGPDLVFCMYKEKSGNPVYHSAKPTKNLIKLFVCP